MRRTAVVVALAGVLSAGASAPARSQTAPQTPPPPVSQQPNGGQLGISAVWNQKHGGPGANPVQGRFVATGGEFGELSYSCDACHGLNGTGDSSGAFPRLAGQSQWYLFDALYNFATGLRPSDIMGPIASELTQQDMQNVAAYYASLPPEPYPEALPTHASQLVNQGEQIAHAGQPAKGVLPCVACHGAEGQGNAPIFPFVGGQYEPYLESQLQRFKSGQRGGSMANVMTQIARGLSDMQIEAVSMYFASLRPKTVTPQRLAPTRAAQQTPEPRPHMGATIHPKPGKGDVVVPGASTRPNGNSQANAEEGRGGAGQTATPPSTPTSRANDAGNNR